MTARRFLLIDISNTFTKWTTSDGETLGDIRRVPTASLDAPAVGEIGRAAPPDARVAFCSVVPTKSQLLREAFAGRLDELHPEAGIGIGIRYPNPREIGPDRLANAIACAHYYGAPAVAVDFGTAVTFDVLSAAGEYLGGVIAPGLGAMSLYLHEKTALLPSIALGEPDSAIGKSTEQAMLAGAVIGYRGLVKEVLRAICEEAFGGKKVPVVATGGDAALIAGAMAEIDEVNPELTLHGIRLFARGRV